MARWACRASNSWLSAPWAKGPESMAVKPAAMAAWNSSSHTVSAGPRRIAAQITSGKIR